MTITHHCSSVLFIQLNPCAHWQLQICTATCHITTNKSVKNDSFKFYEMRMCIVCLSNNTIHCVHVINVEVQRLKKINNTLKLAALQLFAVLIQHLNVHCRCELAINCCDAGWHCTVTSWCVLTSTDVIVYDLVSLKISEKGVQVLEGGSGGRAMQPALGHLVVVRLPTVWCQLLVRLCHAVTLL